MQESYIKHLGFVVKKKELSYDEFIYHWMNTHAQLCKNLPNLLRYSINLVDKERFPKFEYDGFSELWYKTEEILEASFESHEGKILLADSVNFIESRFAIRTKEYQFI